MTWSPRRLLIALPVGLYAFAIPLVANLQVPRGLRVFLYQNRSFAVLGAILACVVLLVMFATPRVARAFRSRWHRQLIATSLLFPIFYAVTSILKARVLPPVIGLYFVWAIAVFFVAPLLYGSVKRLRAVVIALLVANGLAWLIGFALFQLQPPVTTFEGRASFGYSNPNTYAQVIQVVVCAAVFLVLGDPRLRRRRRARLFLWLGCGLCVGLVIAARSRNVLAFAIAAVAAYHMLSIRGGRRGLAIGVAAVIAVAVLAKSDIESIDRFSSGRLSIWKENIDVAFVDRDDGASLLIGTDRDLSRLLARSGYSNIQSTATFEKYHVDNFYLELVIEGGLIGAVLFLFPCVLLGVLFWRLRRDPDERIHANLFLALLVGFAVQSVFTPTFPSFNSPIGFMFAAVAVPAVAASLHRRQSRGHGG